MARGRHRLTRRRGTTALSAVAATCGALVLASAGVFPAAGPATADVSASVPVSYALFQLPDPGPTTFAVPDDTMYAAIPFVGTVGVGPQPVWLPSIGGSGESCMETTDGWACVPVAVNGQTLNTSLAGLTTYIDVLEAPAGMTANDTPPDTTLPDAPDASVDVNPGDLSTTIDQPVPNGGSGAPYCSAYGTAKWLNTPGKDPSVDGTMNCPPDHWFKGYYYIKNKARSAWPVQTYTSYWNSVNGLSVGYGCPSTAHCVTVTDGYRQQAYRDSSGAWRPQYLGLTTYTVDTHNRFTSIVVDFNDSWNASTAVRAEAVCHELGHASGMGHETQNTSCMYPEADGAYTHASNDDFNQLYYHTYGPGTVQ